MSKAPTFSKQGSVMWLCGDCVHLRTQPDFFLNDSFGTCDAFPDGIPKMLALTGDHLTHYPGDNGIIFRSKSNPKGGE